MADPNDLADCPGSFSEGSCTGDRVYLSVSLNFGLATAIISLISCSISVIGSALTILPYILWKDMRSGVREVITYLALADLLTAGGYIIASINYLVYYAENAGQVGVISSESSCVAFDSICQIQAYITSWSSYSSFWWTIILSLYLFGTIVVGNMKQVNRLFPLYHVIAWGTPIIPMFPLLATHSLGYSLFAAAGWCFIRGDRNISPTYSLNAGTVAKILVGGKALEIFTYLWVVIIYIVIKFDIRKKKKAQLMYRYTVTGPVNDNLLKQVEWKLSFIPLLFVAVRIWGTLHFLFSIVVFNASSLMDNNGCISPYVKNIFEALIILQAVGDGGQGWANAILYILMSPKILNRLFAKPLQWCFKTYTKKIAPIYSSAPTSQSTTSPVMYSKTRTNDANVDLTPLQSSLDDSVRQIITIYDD